MVRRAQSDATEDSLKENSSPDVRVNAAKSNQEKATRSVRSTRREQPDDDERHDTQKQEEEKVEVDEAEPDEEDAEGDEDEQVDGSPKGRKRARANSMGDSFPSSSQRNITRGEAKNLPRDRDGFVPGSIVRVQLKNFVTYDFVEFYPCNHLNMILGPNGTGKSSIACALCIGLNFPPSTMGRANEIQSFVKIGEEKGHIELELKGPAGQPNIIIRREINARSKSSPFTINGKAATGKEVNSRIQALNIQVSNLCSFLPQDKVAEFARMTPQQLLRETQRAAVNSRLTAWHDALIACGKDMKKLKEDLAADRQQLQTAEERNANLEREVELHKQRVEIEREIEYYELILPFREYLDAMTVYHECKARKDKLREDVKKLQLKYAPIKRAKTSLTEEQSTLEQERDSKKNACREKYTTMKKFWVRNEQLETECGDYKQKLEDLKRDEKTRQRTMEKLEHDLIGWQNELENPPEIEDIAVIEADRRASALKLRENKNAVDELQERQRAIISEEGAIKQKLDAAQQGLSALQSADHHKLEDLRRSDPDCALAVEWLRSHKDLFIMEVFEPAMLSVTVPDKRYANAIETCFSGNDMKTFVAQCDEDYRTLNHQLIDTDKALGKRVRVNTWFRKRSEPSHLPVDPEELKALGFDGFAMQFAQYPEGLAWFLQNSVGLHRIPIAISHPVDTQEATARLSRHGGVRFIVGNVMNNVTRSKYGQRLPQNSTHGLRQARSFSAQTVDQDKKRDLERQISERQQELADIRARIEELSAEERKLREAHTTIKAEVDKAASRKNAVARAQQIIARLRSSIASATKRLEELRNTPSISEKRAELKKKIVHATLERARAISRYQDLLRQAIRLQVEATEYGLRFLQVSARKIALDRIFDQKGQELAKAQEDLQDAKEAFEEAKADSKTKLGLSKARLDDARQEVQDRFKAAEDNNELGTEKFSRNNILLELETKKAQLELNDARNPGIIQQYERRQGEIKNLTAKIETQEEKLQKAEINIGRIRDQWEPALTQLVEKIGKKFSDAFDRIGCAGQVNIAQHEDYEKWAIEILVKFRDAERLQPLTAERQSGGERSLTTILYLMSLTEYVCAPFSLVDEINQGMDSRAERAVHEALIEVTCRAESGQYFLITPKLLPDLTYHERMKILCVNNGEWIPEEHMAGSLMKMIDGYVAAHSST